MQKMWGIFEDSGDVSLQELRAQHADGRRPNGLAGLRTASRARSAPGCARGGSRKWKDKQMVIRSETRTRAFIPPTFKRRNL